MMPNLEIREVEAGTVIEHEGEPLTVDDQNCVQINGVLFATANTVAKLRARAPARHPATNIGE